MWNILNPQGQYLNSDVRIDIIVKSPLAQLGRTWGRHVAIGRRRCEAATLSWQVSHQWLGSGVTPSHFTYHNRIGMRDRWWKLLPPFPSKSRPLAAKGISLVVLDLEMSFKWVFKLSPYALQHTFYSIFLLAQRLWSNLNFKMSSQKFSAQKSTKIPISCCEI